MALIFKICPEPLWREAEAAGVFRGAEVDLQDGYIHFSTAAQMRDTAAKHFGGCRDLLLIAVDADGLGPSLRFEASRGGDLFPHLYAPLELCKVAWLERLPLGPDGRHVFQPSACSAEVESLRR